MRNSPIIKIICLVSICCLYFNVLFAQAPDAYVVCFTDKNFNFYSVDKPEYFLSSRAIAKRQRYHIPICEEDLPINPTYISAITKFQAVKLLTKSKWMNYIVIQCDDENVLAIITLFPFVDQVRKIHELDVSRFFTESEDQPTVFDSQQREPYQDTVSLDSYGVATRQMSVHNGHILHNYGFKGEGMLVVVLDNGYRDLDKLSCFQSFRANNRLKGMYDAAQQPTYDPYQTGGHGTFVLSIMAIEEPYVFIGTAPRADYVLIRTEMTNYEDLLEEYFWVAGAEYADSIGADVVNASLGYAYFDKPEQEHSFMHLDGKHSVASIAAGILARKACIPCIAAGNEGNKPWHYITIPSDAPDALCVAAMGTDSIIAEFSSRGSILFPTIKPDVTSIGSKTIFCAPIDSLVEGNGTSLASPIIAGLCACLWQAFPEKTNKEIMDAIRQSAHLAHKPDSLFGYGIPDFKAAFDMLSQTSIYTPNNENGITLYPNPSNTYINVHYDTPNQNEKIVQIYDIYGKILKEIRFSNNTLSIALSDLKSGMYMLRIKEDNIRVRNSKFIKN